MPASIRIIKIIKDPFTQTEAYTVEFEVETEQAKDLITELTNSPYGQRIIELLNEAKFLPEVQTKTSEELKAEAIEEEKERLEREENLMEEGRRKGLNKLFKTLRETYGDGFVKSLEEKLKKKEDEEKIVEAASNESTESDDGQAQQPSAVDRHSSF